MKNVYGSDDFSSNTSFSLIKWITENNIQSIDGAYALNFEFEAQIESWYHRRDFSKTLPVVKKTILVNPGEINFNKVNAIYAKNKAQQEERLRQKLQEEEAERRRIAYEQTPEYKNKQRCKYQCEKDENQNILACGSSRGNDQWAECRSLAREAGLTCKQSC